MGKSRDGKVHILPSTTRRGTTLNTSVALDSPSVLSKFLTPPHTHVATSDLDDASTVLDESVSLGPFLDATIARSINTETPKENSATPASSPGHDDELEETYIELDDYFVE